MQTRRKLKIDSGCSELPEKLSACTSYSAADHALSNIKNAVPGFYTGNTDTLVLTQQTVMSPVMENVSAAATLTLQNQISCMVPLCHVNNPVNAID
jgi:hypothetical protein